MRVGFSQVFLISYSKCGLSPFQEQVWLSGTHKRRSHFETKVYSCCFDQSKDPLARFACRCVRHTSACLAHAHVCEFQHGCTHLLPVHVYVYACVCALWVYMHACAPVGMYLSMCLHVCLYARAGGRPRCIHTCTAHLALPLTWLWDSVTPTSIRVDNELDTGTQADHTQIRGPWSWGILAES